MKAERYFSSATQADFVNAIGRGDIERARRFLDNGADVNAVGNEGMTPLYWAMVKQNDVGFRFLLENGADPNISTCWRTEQGPKECQSAIEVALLIEEKPYLSELLDAGADPNKTVHESRLGALYTATLYRRFKSITLLAERGADLNHRSLSLSTPIMDATLMNAYSVALHLLNLGADPMLEDRDGHSAVDVVKEFGNAGVVKGSADEAAYPEFVAELKRRGFW